jgi:protein-S-isoprenylcysteine O-methyltransferase Ste14
MANSAEREATSHPGEARRGRRRSLVDRLSSVTTGAEGRRRLLAPVGLLVASGLLCLVACGGLLADRAFGLPRLLPGVLGSGVGVVLLALGLASWSWCIFLFRGRAVPFNPPRELVVAGPYAWVRNPMLMGLAAALFGLGFILHSVAIVFVSAPAFGVLNMIELKLVEEPELERRLGSGYRDYRNRVPMLIPRRPRAAGVGKSGAGSPAAVDDARRRR